MEVAVQVNNVPTFSSVSEAVEMIRAGMGFLAAADPTQLLAEERAHCLIVLEQVDAVETAARASILAAFTAAQGYTADGQHGTRSWLIHQTSITPAPPSRTPPGPAAATPTPGS
jgi:hypothetical protein